MTMGEESPVAALVLPVLIRPVLDKVERRNLSAGQTLRAAINKVDNAHPGFLFDLVMGVVRRGELSVNMAESLLKLQGSTPEPSIGDIDGSSWSSRPLPEGYQELSRKSQALKKILSRIPDEINDRKTFLETIKEIASAIKKLLDAVNEVSTYIPSVSGRQALEQRKREFVKYSKRFSNTLKDFFREGQAQAVFVSAIYLIHQTNLILQTVKNKSD